MPLRVATGVAIVMPVLAATASLAGAQSRTKVASRYEEPPRRAFLAFVP